MYRLDGVREEDKLDATQGTTQHTTQTDNDTTKTTHSYQHGKTTTTENN